MFNCPLFPHWTWEKFHVLQTGFVPKQTGFTVHWEPHAHWELYSLFLLLCSWPQESGFPLLFFKTYQSCFEMLASSTEVIVFSFWFLYRLHMSSKIKDTECWRLITYCLCILVLKIDFKFLEAVIFGLHLFSYYWGKTV